MCQKNGGYPFEAVENSKQDNESSLYLNAE